MTEKKNEMTEKQDQPPSGSGGVWVAVIIFGVLALIVVVDMLRSKG